MRFIGYTGKSDRGALLIQIRVPTRLQGLFMMVSVMGLVNGVRLLHKKVQ